MLIILLLFYKRIYKADNSGPLVQLDGFGFKSGGSYRIKNTCSASKSVFVALLNTLEKKALGDINNIAPYSVCSKKFKHLAVINYTVELQNSTDYVYGLIKEKSVYLPIVVFCTDQNLVSYIVEAEFQNSGSLLDSRYDNCFIFFQVFIALLTLLLISSLSNHIYFRKGVRAFHLYYDLIIGFDIVCYTLHYLSLLHMKISDSWSFLTLVYTISDVVFYLLLFFFILLVITGWHVIEKSYSYIDVFQLVAYSMAYMTLYVIHAFLGTASFSFWIFFPFVLLLIVLLYAFFCHMKSVDLILRAHLYVIMKNNINPRTTPIFKKRIKYFVFSVSSFVYFTLWISVISLEMSGVIGYWVRDLVEFLLDTTLLIIAFSLFYLNNYIESDYTLLDDAQKISNTEIMDDFISSGDNGDLVDWEDGMLLPPEPIIVDSSTIEQGLVI